MVRRALKHRADDEYESELMRSHQVVPSRVNFHPMASLRESWNIGLTLYSLKYDRTDELIYPVNGTSVPILGLITLSIINVLL